ncbi:hypothetical protein QOZ80_9AG0684900 [Eleusine coracana subsp. coracana]|nr:hypothetical protein QOZ80_9AG0684900 [Eleusine coracana subsp. coracana]
MAATTTESGNSSGMGPIGLDPSPSTRASASKATVTTDKVLTVSANLAQLLPTGSVLAYQSLSASFTNQGECYTSNWWLSLSLVIFLTASCIFFAFTDSIVYKGKVYYGVAMPSRLNLFNLSKKEEQQLFTDLHPDLKKRRLKGLDWVHAFFTAVVFLTVAASDVGLQKCLFPHAGVDAKQLLKNLPLGLAVLSSFVFMIFPTTRNGIGSQFQGSDDCTPSPPDDKNETRPQSNNTASTSRVYDIESQMQRSA